MVEIEVEFEVEREITCPHCNKKSLHVISGTTTVEVEPPEMDDCRD